MHVVEAGDPNGIPILFLHGFPDFSYGWRRQLPFFAAQGLRALAPDLPGYNLSEKPPRVEDYTLASVARAVLAMLDERGIETCHVVGHDWGAALTWHLVSEHAERFVTGAVMCVPPLPVFFDHIRHNRHGQLFRSWYMGLFQIPRIPELLFRIKGGRWLARGLAKSGRPGAFTPVDEERYVDAWNKPGAATGMLNWYRANVRIRGEVPAFRRVSLPMLILWGDEDVALNRHMAEDSLAYCDDGRTVHFEKGTHWIALEFPEEINAALLAHVRRGS